mgnify:FL=1
MTTRDGSTSAFRIPDDPEKRRRVKSFLHSNEPGPITQYAAKDDDELNAAVVAGRHPRIIFADLDELLVTIWKGETQWDRWRGLQVEVILAQSPRAADWLKILDETFTSLQSWRSARRRRLQIAAAILSGIALIAMTVLFSLIPPPR